MSPLRILRLVALLEGVSFHLLLGVAMPLKYALGMPEAVRVAGGLHGALFVAFVGALAWAASERRWALRRSGAIFAAASVPLGMFWIDATLRQDIERIAEPG